MPPQTDTDTQELTVTEVAKLVFREVPKLDKEGKDTGKTEEKPISPDEVYSWRDHGDHVVVVTKDGQKFRGEKKAPK